MTIKVKISELQPAAFSLHAIAQVKSKFKFGYDIAKRLRAINAELKEIDENRMNLLKELSGGKMTEDGKNFDLGDKSDEFSNKYKEILDTEIELNVLPMLTTDFADIEIEPAHLINIDFLIQEPQPAVNDNAANS